MTPRMSSKYFRRALLDLCVRNFDTRELDSIVRVSPDPEGRRGVWCLATETGQLFYVRSPGDGYEIPCSETRDLIPYGGIHTYDVADSSGRMVKRYGNVLWPEDVPCAGGSYDI